MRPRILTIFVLLFLTGTGLKAQVNGYLGKRFIAGYKAGLALNSYFFSPDQGPDPEKDGVIALRHTLHADYILGRRFMLGGEYVFSPVNYTSTYIGSTGEGLEYNVSTNITVMSAVFTFHGIASKSCLSPVGDYFQMKISKATAKVTDEHETISGTSTLKPFTGQLKRVGFGFGYGHNQVVADNLLLDVGVELNIFPSAWADEYTPDNTSGSKDADQFINSRISSYSLMVFRLGIGGLLF